MAFSLTIFGRSLMLVISELLANAICWAVAAILFSGDPETRPILSLALLAWTLGLRHALDADHIRFVIARANIKDILIDRDSAIDNATRALINLNQLPVTCGLFFSLGHSTIVILVTVAIAVSVQVYDKLSGFSNVGGIIGPAVSGAFLFIVGVGNSIILWRIIRTRRKRPRTNAPGATSEASEEARPKQDSMIMMRILGPVLTFVNRPWKMYPVGLLFGLGFDTASSIALISISTIAKQKTGSGSFPPSHIIILPLLFTAGMSLLDSVDSIIMLYSYTGFPEKKWRVFQSREKNQPKDAEKGTDEEKNTADQVVERNTAEKDDLEIEEVSRKDCQNPQGDQLEAVVAVKTNVMSGLSILLTIMSIMLAFTISLITIMSLIGEQCSQCRSAAEAEDGGGLAGRWWRGWANAAEQSGWIGIGIVGMFIITVGGWYLARWLLQRRSQGSADQAPSTTDG